MKLKPPWPQCRHRSFCQRLDFVCNLFSVWSLQLAANDAGASAVLATGHAVKLERDECSEEDTSTSESSSAVQPPSVFWYGLMATPSSGNWSNHSSGRRHVYWKSHDVIKMAIWHDKVRWSASCSRWTSQRVVIAIRQYDVTKSGDCYQAIWCHKVW